MAEMNPYFEDIYQGLKHFDLTKLDGKTILITGATGLIGGCLVDVLMLSESNCEVYAFGRNEERAKKRFKQYWNIERFHFIKGDITQKLDCSQTFDYIIHAASNASPNFFKEKPVEVIKSNVLGVANLMEYGTAHGMKRFLFVSSGEIYGEGDGRLLTEEYSGYVDCTKPRACYPSSKRAAETLCVSYAAEYGVDVVIARPCHTYGPFFTESDNRVYAQFIRNIVAGEDIVMKSVGLQKRSWLYVVDCVFALFTILLKGKNCEAYNVADRQSEITIRQLAELLAKYGNKKVVFDNNESTDNTTPITYATFSSEKITLLGWLPFYSIEDGLYHSLKSRE